MKPFEKPGVMKTTERKYFKGNKKLKNIKMYEDFSAVNEADVDAVAARKLRVTKDFKDQVTAMVEMSKKYQAMKEDLDKLGKLLGKQEGEVQKVLEKYGAVFVEIDSAIGKIAVELKNKSGRETKSYKEISEALEELLPKTEEVVKQTTDIYNKFTKHNPDKKELEYKVQEGISDIVKSIGSWFKTQFSKLKSMLPGFEKSADKLKAAVA